jgi:hypothetical protein
MPLQQIESPIHIIDGRVEVRGRLPRELDDERELAYDPLVAIAWYIVQGDEIVQGTVLAGGAWPSDEDAGDLVPGPAVAGAVSVILRRLPAEPRPGFEVFTWTQDVELV